MRRLLAPLLALAALGPVAATGCGATARAPAADPAPGSTLRGTWVDPDGDGTLARGPGQPLRDRTDLAPAARSGRVLGSLAVLTDVHVRDEESPARAAFLDRLGPPFQSTFRPQESLTTQVLTAAVRSINAAGPQDVLDLGDLIDNTQANEMSWATRVLNGGLVHPDSGAPGYQGPQEASNPDPSYYRPDVDPPRHPGLLARAQRSFRSPGLRAPWWAVPGNHDLLVAGELARTPETEAIAVGDRAVVAPDPELAVPRSESALQGPLLNQLMRLELRYGRTVRVPPDLARRELSPAEAVAALRKAGRRPGGGARMDAAFDLGRRVRVILLDTVRRDRGAGGIVTPAQTRWLAAQLQAAGDRWVIVASHQPLTNDAGGAGAFALLDRDPHVLAALDGDTHHNRIQSRRTSAGGYWLIQTASLADYPQQARMLRVRETAGGGAVLETWMLDTAPDPLADTARELAYLDAQGGRPDHEAGTPLDRNVRLFHRPPS